MDQHPQQRIEIMIVASYEYLMSSLPHLTFQKSEEEQRRVIGLFQKYAGNTAKAWSVLDILDQEAQKFLPAPALLVFQKIDLKNIHQEAFRKSNIKVLAAFSKSTFELKSLISAWRKPAYNEEKKSA